MAGGPDSLIPGDPDQLYSTVASLTRYADLLTEAGNGLRQIDVGSNWSGPAAEAYHHAYQAQPPRWLQAGDAFRAAASAVDEYAGSLRWAQQQAASAISKFQSANTADQNEAQSILTNARDQLDSAADLAARAVRKAAESAPAAPGFWSRLGSGIANIADAAIQNPGAMASEVEGAAAIGAGALLIASGIGAVPGALVMAGGAALGTYGTIKIDDTEQAKDDGTGVNYSPPVPATAQEMTERASQLGFGQAVPQQRTPFDSHGQPVYTDGGSYITPDGDGWELLDKDGNRLGLYTWDLTWARK